MLVAHVVISLLGVALGLAFFQALLGNRRRPTLVALFLVSNVLTSLSGLPLPADHFLPSHAFVVICLTSLALAGYGLYAKGLAGGWRRVYVVGSLLATYLNVVVLIVQSFDKIPALPGILVAPTQLLALLAFLGLGGRALRNFQC